jgi:hypothetical protein
MRRRGRRRRSQAKRVTRVAQGMDVTRDGGDRRVGKQKTKRLEKGEKERETHTQCVCRREIQRVTELECVRLQRQREGETAGGERR